MRTATAKKTTRKRPDLATEVAKLKRRVARLEELLEDRLDVEESERLLADPKTEWVDLGDARQRWNV